MRTIVHVDMDAFFCAVETLHHPEYKGKPLVVGGRKDSPRAVVASCSYEARRFGIHSAMPIQKAARLCPHAIFVPVHMERYTEVSQSIHAIFRSIAPVVEPLSIDEAFLDMTGCEHLYSSLRLMGEAIREKVYSTVKCTASVGIAPNKFLAKLASDLDKPDGLYIIDEKDVPVLLPRLPVNKLWGVGQKTGQILHGHGITTIGDLQQKSEAWLQNLLGKSGVLLYALARGIDHRPVQPNGCVKSIGHEVTFAQDVAPGPQLQKALSGLVHEVALRLRTDGRYARTLHLKVRFSDFTTVTRSYTAANSFQGAPSMLRIALSLLEQLPARHCRLIGISVSELGQFAQRGLFADSEGTEGKVDQLLRDLNKDRHNRITTAAALAATDYPRKKSNLE